MAAPISFPIMHLLNPFVTNHMRQEVNFFSGVYWFKFNVFLLLDWLPNQG